MSWLSGAGTALTPNRRRLAGGWAGFKGLKNIKRIIKNASASDEMVAWGRRLQVATFPLENIETWLQTKQKYAANRHSDPNVLTAECRSDGAARGSQLRRKDRRRGVKRRDPRPTGWPARPGTRGGGPRIGGSGAAGAERGLVAERVRK